MSHPSGELVHQPDTTEFRAGLVRTKALSGLLVTDEDSARIAKTGLDWVEQLYKDINKKFEKPCKAAYEAHKGMVALRDEFLDPCERLSKYLRTQLKTFEESKQARLLEVQQQLQEQAEEATDPWDEPAQPVVLMPTPTVSGMTLKKKPLRVEVVNKQALIVHVAELIKKGDLTALNWLQPDLGVLQATARKWGKNIAEARMPGVRVIAENTIARTRE